MSQKEMSNSGPAVDLAPKDCFAGADSLNNDSLGQFNFEKLDIDMPDVQVNMQVDDNEPKSLEE